MAGPAFLFRCSCWVRGTRRGKTDSSPLKRIGMTRFYGVDCGGASIHPRSLWANSKSLVRWCYPATVMDVKALTPILNVSDIAGTVAWFEKWGWKKLWDWGSPPTFGAVGSVKKVHLLCQGAQGGRGRGATPLRFSRTETNRATKASGCRSGWTTSTNAQALRRRRARDRISAY